MAVTETTGAAFRAPALIAAALLALPFGAARAQTVNVAHGERLTVTSGQAAVLAGADGSTTTIRLVAVHSDERCPADVACSWERPPVATIELGGFSARTTARIVLGPASRPVVVNEWSIRGVDLLPRSVRGERFGHVKPIGLYSAILIVTRSEPVSR